MNFQSFIQLKRIAWIIPLMIGLVIGRFSFSHQSQDPERNNESGVTHSSTEPRLHEALSRRSTSSGIRGGFQKDLSNILGTNDRVERTRLLLALIDGMSSSEFEEIAKTFQQENWTNHHETECSLSVFSKSHELESGNLLLA